MSVTLVAKITASFSSNSVAHLFIKSGLIKHLAPSWIKTFSAVDGREFKPLKTDFCLVSPPFIHLILLEKFFTDFNNSCLSFGCPIIPTQLTKLADNTDFIVQKIRDSPSNSISNLFLPAFILLPLPAAGISTCTII